MRDKDGSLYACGDLAVDDRFQFLEEHMGAVFHSPDLLLASVLGLATLDHVVEAFVEFAQCALVRGDYGNYEM